MAMAIRGYGHVKDASIVKYREQLSATLDFPDESNDGPTDAVAGAIARQIA
jgi:hypothetical protein